MKNREKLDNLRRMLDTLIDTCESKISITTRLLVNTRNKKEIDKLILEKAFWEGKLEVAKYAKLFSE